MAGLAFHDGYGNHFTADQVRQDPNTLLWWASADPCAYPQYTCNPADNGAPTDIQVYPDDVAAAAAISAPDPSIPTSPKPPDPTDPNFPGRTVGTYVWRKFDYNDSLANSCGDACVGQWGWAVVYDQDFADYANAHLTAAGGFDLASFVQSAAVGSLLGAGVLGVTGATAAGNVATGKAPSANLGAAAALDLAGAGVVAGALAVGAEGLPPTADAALASPDAPIAAAAPAVPPPMATPIDAVVPGSASGVSATTIPADAAVSAAPVAAPTATTAATAAAGCAACAAVATAVKVAVTGIVGSAAGQAIREIITPPPVPKPAPLPNPAATQTAPPANPLPWLVLGGLALKFLVLN